MAGAKPGRYDRVSLITGFFMTCFHIGAIWALIDFTWSGVIVLLATYYVSLAWGIGMSYHRLLTHRSYRTSKPVEYFLTICATLALEGGPLFWVATHRQHHQHSDADPDPHTPRHGFNWAHMLWSRSAHGAQRRQPHCVRAGPRQGRVSIDSSACITIAADHLGSGWALGGWNWRCGACSSDDADLRTP